MNSGITVRAIFCKYDFSLIFKKFFSNVILLVYMIFILDIQYSVLMKLYIDCDELISLNTKKLY